MRRIALLILLPTLLLADALADRFSVSRLPYPESDRILYEVSTFDRDGRNLGDGFFGGNYLYIENGEYVVFDEAGPGILVNLWMPRDSTGARVGTFRFFLDKDSLPAFSITRQALFSGNSPQFPYPLTLAEDSGRGGAFSFSPLPFHKRLKVRFSSPPAFYHFLFYRLKDDSACPPFSPLVNYRGLADSLLRPSSIGGAAAQTRHVTIPAGATLKVYEYNGCGTLRRLSVSPPSHEPEVLNRVKLTGYWNGSAWPQLFAPLGELFGIKTVWTSYTSRLASVSDSVMSLEFPMPLSRSAVFYVKNENSMPVSLTLTLLLDPQPPGESALPFQAYWHAEPAYFFTGHDYPVLSVQGRGHFAGSFLYVSGDRGKIFLEGDERFYADGRSFPDFHGTGLEDYFLSGWYFDDKIFAQALNGCLSSVLDSRAHLAMMRFHLSDRVPFLSGFKAGIEKGPVNVTGSDYSSVAFFYQEPGRQLVRTDTLVLGDSASEHAHRFRYGKLLDLRGFWSAYGGDSTDARWWVNKSFLDSIQFRTSLRPDNRGVILRAITDVARGGQRMAVYADGRYAGDWSISMENPFNRVYDADFFLPESLTRGRDSVEVKIRLLSDAWSIGFNAMRYETHCISPDTVFHAPFSDINNRWLVRDWSDGSMLTFVWPAVQGDGGITPVAVYRDTVSGFTCGPATLAGVTRDLSFTDSRLNLGKKYYYRFQPFGPDGLSLKPSDLFEVRTSGNLFREGESFSSSLLSASCPVSVYTAFNEDGEHPGLPDTVTGRDTLLSNARTLRVAAAGAGDSAVFSLFLSGSDTFGLEMQHQTGPSDGIFELRVNNRPVGLRVNAYAESSGVHLARADSLFILSSGLNRIAVHALGRDIASTGYGAGLDYLRFFTLSEQYLGLPDSLKLRISGCFPNPFNPRVTFGFTLGQNSRVDAAVFDVRGVKMRTLAKEDLVRRAYRLTWDGHDGAGRPCPAGVYFLTVRACGLARSVKAVLLR